MRSPIEIVADWLEGDLSPTAMVDLIERYGAACAAEQRERDMARAIRALQLAGVSSVAVARALIEQAAALAPTPTPR